MKTTAAGHERRLRIALLTDCFGKHFGGAEAYGVELMRALAPHHEITVIARQYDSPIKFNYLQVRISQYLPSWLRVLYFAWRAHFLTRGHFDIVHSHISGWVGQVQVMHVTPSRYKFWYLKNTLQRYTAWLNPRTAAYLLLEKTRGWHHPGRRIVAVSELVASQIHTVYGQEIPVTLIPPGITLPDPLLPSQRIAIRQALGWNAHTIGCLLVARNPLRKGLRAILETLPRLPSEYRLLVVGADAATQRAVSAAKAVRERVTLIAPITDITGYFQAADLYVQPTLNDSFGLSVLEAMAHGLPVILSALPYCGLAQYLQHEQNALLLEDPRDPNQITHALTRLGTDSSLRHQLSQGGLQVARSFTWEKVAQRYTELYTEILQQEADTPRQSSYWARKS